MVRNALLGLIMLMSLSSRVMAGAEVELALNKDTINKQNQAEVSVGYGWQYAWVSAGFRAEDSFFASAGPKIDVIGITVRVGGIALIHEDEHAFGGSYPDGHDSSPAYGWRAGIGFDAGLYQPFVRYQVFQARHTYKENRTIGTDKNGNPIYGDPVSHSENETIEEWVVGVRMSF